MDDLRDPFFDPNTVSLDEMERLQTSGMGSLRRGWEAGRIGTERNALDGSATKHRSQASRVACRSVTGVTPGRILMPLR